MLSDPVLVALRELVDENPGRRNATGDGCVYTLPDGRPCCVIAHLADRVGWRRPGYLDDDNQRRASEVWPDQPRIVHRVLDKVQFEADEGITWGGAYAYACRVIFGGRP